MHPREKDRIVFIYFKGSMAVGYDHLDIDAIKARGIKVKGAFRRAIKKSVLIIFEALD